MQWWDGSDSAPMVPVGVDGRNLMNEWMNKFIASTDLKLTVNPGV